LSGTVQTSSIRFRSLLLGELFYKPANNYNIEMEYEYNYTTISVTPETRDKVKARKNDGEAYNDVVKRLLSEGEQK